MIWSVNLGFGILSILTVFAWIGLSGSQDSAAAQPEAFVFHIYYHISDSLWAGLAFAIIFLAGINSMVHDLVKEYVHVDSFKIIKMNCTFAA